MDIFLSPTHHPYAFMLKTASLHNAAPSGRPLENHICNSKCMYNSEIISAGYIPLTRPIPLLLQKSAYWSSWALTHFSTMAVSGILCAVIGLYPFRHSSFAIMLSFYWLLACSLISFSYFLSTIFSKSRIAGTVTAVLYALAMVPG